MMARINFCEMFNSDIFDVENEMRIVLIGRTGCGKSATGNTILGEKVFESKACPHSVTRKCMQRKAKGISVVDTPGLFDTEMTNTQVLKEVAKCVGLSAPGPHAFVLVVSVGRFTKEEEDTVKLFVREFGDDIMKYLVVLFTKRDDLENDKMSIDEYVRHVKPELKQILKNCGNRPIAFNNRAANNETKLQVKELLDLIREMVRRNGGSYYTNVMYATTEKNIQTLIETQRSNFIHEHHLDILNSPRQQKEVEAIHEPSDYELRSKIRDGIEEEDKGIIASVYRGVAAGAAIGSEMFGDIGAAVGGVIGGSVGFVLSWLP